jgi:hypothetical protein
MLVYRLILAAGFGLSLSTTAAAQVVGAYVGHSRDGQSVRFNVSEQEGTTSLWVHDATVFIEARCERSHTFVTWGEAYGVGQDIVDGRVAAERALSPYFNIKFKLRFSPGGETATGVIRSVIPALDLRHVPATRALYCVSPWQTLTVALAPAGLTATKASPPDGAATDR